MPFRSWVSLAKSPHLCDPRCPPLWEEKGASDVLWVVFQSCNISDTKFFQSLQVLFFYIFIIVGFHWEKIGYLTSENTVLYSRSFDLCTECKRVRERKKERTLSNIIMSVFARKLSVWLSPSYIASPTLSAHKSTNLYTVYTAEKPCATQSDTEHRLVPNRKRSISRMYIVTLLI